VYLSSNFAQYWIVFINRKDKNSILKYPVFIRTLGNKKKSYNQNSKQYVLTCILTLITSLLNSQELTKISKKKKLQKKSFCFLLILRITRLYVRHSLDIKKIVFLKNFRMIRFLRSKIRTFLPRRTFLKP
jgi:hypothetical protein